MPALRLCVQCSLDAFRQFLGRPFAPEVREIELRLLADHVVVQSDDVDAVVAEGAQDRLYLLDSHDEIPVHCRQFSYAAGHASSQMGYGDYLLIQLLRLVSLPFLHGIWTGISAYFAGLSAINPSARRAVILVGLIGVSVMHGLYNTFSDGWIGLGLAMLSLAVFIGYVRDEAGSVEAVSKHAAEPVIAPETAG